MEVTSSSSSWSHRPEPDLIGVSVFQRQNQFSLRFHLRTTHLKRINNPKALGIRGSAQNGSILTPDSEGGVKPSRVAKSDLFYVMQTLNKFDLSKRERRTVWMRPEFESGHRRVPPLPPAWINVDADFMPAESTKEEDPRTITCKNWYSISRTVLDNHAHCGNADDCSVRAFAVKPRAFGAPLCGVGARPLSATEQRGHHAANACRTMLPSIEDTRSSDNVRQVECWFPQLFLGALFTPVASALVRRYLACLDPARRFPNNQTSRNAVCSSGPLSNAPQPKLSGMALVISRALNMPPEPLPTLSCDRTPASRSSSLYQVLRAT